MKEKNGFKDKWMILGGKRTRVLVPTGPRLSNEDAWRLMKPILSRINRRLEKAKLKKSSKNTQEKTIKKRGAFIRKSSPSWEEMEPVFKKMGLNENKERFEKTKAAWWKLAIALRKHGEI